MVVPVQKCKLLFHLRNTLFLKGESETTKMAWPKRTQQELPKRSEKEARKKNWKKRDNESDEWRQRQHGEQGRHPSSSKAGVVKYFQIMCHKIAEIVPWFTLTF